MDFAYLYTSFDGRINRKPFWMAVLLIIVVSVVVSIAIGLMLGLQSRAFKIFGLLWQLALLYPSLAVMVKRLHDRDRPDYFAYIMIAPSLVTAITNAIGITGDPLNQNALDYLLGILTLAVGIWALIELGCLRGTAGPNRYGPDPLQAPQPLRA